jgi:hypothetical protein
MQEMLALKKQQQRMGKKSKASCFSRFRLQLLQAWLPPSLPAAPLMHPFANHLCKGRTLHSPHSQSQSSAHAIQPAGRAGKDDLRV